MNFKIVRAVCVVVTLHAGGLAQSIFTWSQLGPGTSPSARILHSMTYDGARQRVVLFGGDGGASLGDTWELDGSAWLQRTPQSSPAARSHSALVYDAARQRVILFGGSSSTGATFGDTWEWDGTNWAQRTTSSGPGPRSSHAMAFDAARQRVVLFGGLGGSVLADTWEWDGFAWIPRFSITYPSARRFHALAYDSSRQRVVLFGGTGAGVLLGDTWEWDGSNWTNMTPTVSPSARQRLAMTFNASRQRVILFGGSATGAPLGDTWEWDGTNWTLLVPAVSPSPRSVHAMSYDEAHQRVVVHGGDGGIPPYLSDTWVTGVPGIPSSAITYGVGCGFPSVALSPDPLKPPISGQTAGATIANSPTPIGAVMIGLSNQSYGPFSLPVTLAGIGMPGCELLQSADIMGFPVTPLSPTTMAFSAFLAPTPSLVGLHVYLQAYVLAPSANALGILVSNGIDWLVGNV